jgi:hypothetical protein
MQIADAKEVIFRLEVTQDTRPLSVAEAALRRFLKVRYLSLTSLQRTIARQQSSMRWLHDGEANTKFFHLHTNNRQQRNHIAMLHIDGATLVIEEEKAEAAFNYFSEVLGSPHYRDGLLDFEAFGIHLRDLSELGHPFTEDEIWAVIRKLPLDKVPEPDGFTGRSLPLRLVDHQG